MISITAILVSREGEEQGLKDALLKVATHARAHEPGTVGYFVAQDIAVPQRFTTYERYHSEAAMEFHNGSESVADFFASAKTMLAEPALVITADEL